MKNRIAFFLISMSSIVFLCTVSTLVAGYKARTWDVSDRESYPARLTSEGVTIAVNPLFNDALAAQVFDKNDMVTRGIMPLAILIFNDNDYAVEVDGTSIELIHGRDHVRTMTPAEVENRLYGKGKSLLGQTLSRPSNEKALDDFAKKFLMHKSIAPHSKEGGFVYIPAYDPLMLESYLSTATVYIPNVYRKDDGSRLVFFEIDVNAALSSAGGAGQNSDSNHDTARP